MSLSKHSSFITLTKPTVYEQYYRKIPLSEIDIAQIKRDLDTGVNLILDGIECLGNDDNDAGMDKILDGLFALTYQRYLMD